MSTTIEIEDIIDYILIHDLEFPGKHQFKYRNSLLRLNKQMMVAIWDELFLQIKQHMKENNKCTSIRIRNFGTFCYLPYNEISTDTYTNFTNTMSSFKSLNIEQPTFILDETYRYILKHFPQTDKILSLHTGYLPKKMLHLEWNSFPIAKKLNISQLCVTDTIKCIFDVIYKLVKEGFNVVLKSSFVYICFIKGELKVMFDDESL